MAVRRDLDIQAQWAGSTSLFNVWMTAQVFQGIQVLGCSLMMMKLFHMFLEIESSRICCLTSEGAVPGPPVILSHVVYPVAAARILVLWCFTSNGKADVRFQIPEDMFPGVHELAQCARCQAKMQSYFHSRLVSIETTMRQNGH
jgi:hypothetical protein